MANKPEWHPETVQMRFEEANPRDHVSVFLAATLRKISTTLDSGVSLQNALNIVAGEIEKSTVMEAVEISPVVGTGEIDGSFDDSVNPKDKKE